jgi:NAD(P)-dependent dehydrogenase (short-subunit alcohol dehydrogenase family)
MHPADFRGQVALVTGASSGIGLATAKAGAAVVLADFNENTLNAAVESLELAGHQTIASLAVWRMKRRPLHWWRAR